MIRYINSFFIGFLLVLMLDFLIFVGMKINYIDLYNIKEYYNIFFVDHQNILLLLFLSMIFGYLFINKKTFKFFSFFYLLLILASLLTFYKPVGKSLAEFLFRKNDLTFEVAGTRFDGDLLYKGRRYSYIFRKDISKVIKVKNKDIKSGS